MKRIILAIILAASSLSTFAQAKSYDLAVIQSVYSKNKADLVKSTLALNEAQDKAFWPIYDQYEAERVSLSNQRVAIVEDYLKSYDKLTGDQATALMNRIFANEKSYTDLQKTFFPKFSGAVGGTSAAKFYQVENYLQLIVRLHFQDQIPFIGELDKQKH